MKISESERVAILGVVAYGRAHGFGNMISHLKTAWASALMEEGFSEQTARRAAGGPGYPLQMQRDLIERGEWDETGARYRKPARKTKSRKAKS